MRFLTGLAATAAFTIMAAATPAAAQVAATPPAIAKALLVRPLTFVRVDDLDFGTVASGATQGVVAIDAFTGGRTTTGGVTGLTSAPGKRALFAGSGTASQTIAVLSLVAPANLINTVTVGGVTTVNTIKVLGLNLDGSVVRTIDPTTNAFYVGVGGAIEVAANQPEGDYSATFDITVDYN
jgi:Domain of unknown function (DUF4402)